MLEMSKIQDAQSVKESIVIHRETYRKHVMTAHKDGNRKSLALKSYTKVINTTIIPEWNDPSIIVDHAGKVYSCKSNYRRHIKTLHKDVLQKAIQLSSPKPSQ